jgi:nitrate reductase assembly molybdenum cofactor insertion protein NarJ
MTTNTRPIFDLFAVLVKYPESNFDDLVNQARELLTVECPDAVSDLDAFAAALEGLTDGQRQELYTQTFDHCPDTALELGWHVHGENYARGTFLVAMRTLMNDLGVEESAELPDHLSHVLMCLTRMHTEQAELLYWQYLPKGLEKILAGITEPGNPYEDLIHCLRKSLSCAFGHAEEDSGFSV